MSDDLPYRAEYAKSDRSKCQQCKQPISKQSLRIAAIVQSPVHDGTIPRWYHFECFFEKQRPKSTADIACFDEIRLEDQEEIQKKIEEFVNAPPVSGKGRKRTKGGGASGSAGDFRVEYAKSNKSTCKGCDEKIIKGETRISKKDYETAEARRFGGLDRWHHVECFAKLRADLGYYGSGDELPGVKELSKEDRNSLKAALPKMTQGEMPPPPKKIKEEPEDAEDAELMKKQNVELYTIKDKITPLGKNKLVGLLEKNHQEIPTGISNILSLLCDILYFGALEPCPKCKGQLIYNSGIGYKCTGNVTEWTKCTYVTQDPKRKKCEIPSDMKKEFPIKSYRSKVRKRVFKITAPSSSSSVKEEVDGPKIQAKPRPLKNMQFVIQGRTQKDKEELKKEILLLGGTVTTKIHEDLAAVISNQNELEKMNKRMEEVQACDIQVITEDFIEEAKEYTDAPIMLLKKKTISSWGGDINARLSNVIAKSNASKSKSRFEKSSSGKVKVKVKGGGAVDPDSGLENCAHIYQKGKNKYTATLGLTDIQSKKNSYYKLQILKHDKFERYHLFRSWGRIGTTIGGNKLEELSLEECIEQFESLYEEKTGNQWKNRQHFVKVPNLMYPIDIDHGDEEIASLDSDIKSNLAEPIQNLMRLIFDVAEMKKVMLEFEIDMDKMPLGKLSKKQIEKAYAVLTELQEILKKSNIDHTTLIDASNRFYTLIPHNFGISGPKILESSEEIKNKCDMLDALLEMEIAYNLLRDTTDGKQNPLDSHYKQLKTDIEILNKSSEEFKMIDKYVQNTHAATHTQYKLEIEEVFVVKRQGEEQRFKPFKKLPNRKLLWHGSRTTNFAGILSQGLRIAPPEAPVTGYMFGKGIYFADMVSKSANYCCTHSQSPTGLLLLCEVALGNMHERYKADYIEKLPKGKHSTLGRGQTEPDPKDVHKLDDGVEVPYGMGVPATHNKKSDLLYNEYIVYDVAQVKVRYLIRMNFKYKY
ncbi:Poly [ADP-ribose] polymerase [Camponotus floridanus]|uniref:Poly [ADP-ribose] polymerase n=1 Tax=Camponotus floridanus TaxID=104421 RepID=E2AAA6_CAMFO|nr:poly [ADP-ribose] polymerase [Camponotus floridanus]EFN69632.1 Poly [ADP-ribose] polymerase [Camponotus floridanus]